MSYRLYSSSCSVCIYCVGKEQNLTLTEDGSKETFDIVVTPHEPTAYEYGIYAEEIAEWINETTGTKTRQNDIATQADETDSPIQNITIVPCYIDPVAVFEKHKGITIDADKRRNTEAALHFRESGISGYFWLVISRLFDITIGKS